MQDARQEDRRQALVWVAGRLRWERVLAALRAGREPAQERQAA